MNATRNETRRTIADCFRANPSRNVIRWSERLLAACDALATALLWGFWAATTVRFALFPFACFAELASRAASTLVWLTFAMIGAYLLRETVCVWRDAPCRLPKSEFRSRVRSASIPLWATAAVVAATLGASGGETACATAWGAAFYVVCVDVGAGRFARRWGATVARDWRLAWDNDATLFLNLESEVDRTSQNAPFLDASLASVETTSCDEKSQSAPRFAPSLNCGGDVSLETVGICGALASVFAREDGAEEEEEGGETIATQRRVRANEGGEQIFGTVAVEFEADAEIAPVFIAFCPPFEGVPSFEFEQVAGPEIVLRATSVQPFGARLEAKRRLAQIVDEQEVANGEKARVEYFASFPPFDEAEETAF